jgi:hypothetical protein
MGSHHDEIGILASGRGGMLALTREAGGTWQLDAPLRFRRLIGQRVRVVGVRADFDVLDVTTIEPAGHVLSQAAE